MQDLLKSKSLSVRCGAEDKNAIEERAKEANMSISDYVRYSCLEKEGSDDTYNLLITTLEEIGYLLVQLKQKEIKKKKCIESMEEVLNTAWQSLR